MPNSDDRERTANTAADITTSNDQQNQASTDPAADAVEGMVDNVQAAFQGRKKEERH
ncbi:hypothetical protein [uncultured Paenibacillus sp.]|uniref:hypothetical protein n=1 Tax=uncultured Paenibacillus sp. TaxID=227322 RepID=UPI0028D5239D|nr:hypothetical protein [uncultured Paenibacillus sp.]